MQDCHSPSSFSLRPCVFFSLHENGSCPQVPAALLLATDSEIQAAEEPLARTPADQPMPLHQLANSAVPPWGALPPGTRIILQVPKDYGGQTALAAAAAPGAVSARV